jgi:hypothetical protein
MGVCCIDRGNWFVFVDGAFRWFLVVGLCGFVVVCEDDGVIMKDIIKVVLTLERFKSDRDDIGNLDCENCGKQCQRSKEVWYWIEFDISLIAFCYECVRTLKKSKELKS